MTSRFAFKVDIEPRNRVAKYYTYRTAEPEEVLEFAGFAGIDEG